MTPRIVLDENMQAASSVGRDFIAKVAWLESNSDVRSFRHLTKVIIYVTL